MQVHSTAISQINIADHSVQHTCTEHIGNELQQGKPLSLPYGWFAWHVMMHLLHMIHKCLKFICNRIFVLTNTCRDFKLVIEPANQNVSHCLFLCEAYMAQSLCSYCCYRCLCRRFAILCSSSMTTRPTTIIEPLLWLDKLVYYRSLSLVDI